MIKKIAAIILSAMLLLTAFPAYASSGTMPELSAPAAVLMDANSGKVLFEKNSHKKRACASITKVMTLTLVMEALDSGRLKLTDTLTASAHAASMGGSDIWLEEGETMSVDDLIKATAVASANDAAVVLAEALCGSEETFVAEMNKKAQLLGMKETTFKNCNGLDAKGHLTSAYDVALMSAELCKHKKIFDYTSIWMDNLRGGKTQIVNTNKLLRTYSGITGLKTGTTNQAGCCMSATAERDGLSLISVVLGCGSGTERFRDSAVLLDHGFANYTLEKLSLPEEYSDSVEVKDGMEKTLYLACDEPGSVVIGRNDSGKITTEYKLKKEVKAPVKTGDTIGEVNYYLGQKLLKSCKITAKNSIEKRSFKTVAAQLFGALFS